MLLIQRIEGNSNVGTPVFSVMAIRNNFKFKYFNNSYEK